jgi:hypothetical protein
VVASLTTWSSTSLGERRRACGEGAGRVARRRTTARRPASGSPRDDEGGVGRRPGQECSVRSDRPRWNGQLRDRRQHRGLPQSRSAGRSTSLSASQALGQLALLRPAQTGRVEADRSVVCILHGRPSGAGLLSGRPGP